MKLLKFTLLSAVIVSALNLQAASENEDKARVAEFADKPAEIMLVDVSANKERKITLKSAEGKDFIFIDSAGGELTVAKNSKTFKFAIRAGDNWNRARSAYNRGDYVGALSYMRPIVYPLLPFACCSEDVFAVHGYLDLFISATINAGFLKEAEAIVEAMPLATSPLLTHSALEVANALVDAGKSGAALKILDRVNIDTQENISMAMDTLDKLRLKGVSKPILVWYTKLSNMKDNSEKDVATLWMVYCDMALGNTMSAQIYLSTLKVPTTSEVFSLCQMVKGMYKEHEKKYSEALDLYAEGIVFGKLSSDWMPELLYKAGMVYKKLKNLVAANEVFLQINAIYPDSEFAPKAKKEIVKIEPKKKDSEEDDEDEE